MKLATLITLRPTLRILSLACAELAEILCGLWSHVRKELHLDAPKGLSCASLVVNPYRLSSAADNHSHRPCKRGDYGGYPG